MKRQNFKKITIELPTERCWEDNEQEFKALLQECTFNLCDISEVGRMIHMNVMLEIKRYNLFRKSNNGEQMALCAKNVIVCF